MGRFLPAVIKVTIWHFYWKLHIANDLVCFLWLILFTQPFGSTVMAFGLVDLLVISWVKEFDAVYPMVRWIWSNLFTWDPTLLGLMWRNVVSFTQLSGKQWLSGIFLANHTLFEYWLTSSLLWRIWHICVAHILSISIQIQRNYWIPEFLIERQFGSTVPCHCFYHSNWLTNQ